MNSFFSSLVLSQADAMETYLFYLLKASNTPLVLFDRIIYWVKTMMEVLVKMVHIILKT